jgi:hypothetical protein
MTALGDGHEGVLFLQDSQARITPSRRFSCEALDTSMDMARRPTCEPGARVSRTADGHDGLARLLLHVPVL